MIANLTGPDAVLAALTSLHLTVPPAPADAGPPSLGWLRASVARFSDGAEHGPRRGAAVSALAAVDADTLRRNAFRRTKEVLATGREVDLMAEVARVVPVAVLAEALGVTGEVRDVVADVAAVARVYLTGAENGEPTGTVDAAVARLAMATGRGTGENAAAVVGLLVQAYEATAGLIGNACLAALRAGPSESTESSESSESSETSETSETSEDAERAGDGDMPANAERVVDQTLHDDPPVLATRRLATVDTTVGDVHIGAGGLVRVDLASADRSLGAGPHACPGAAQARGIAAGVVEAVEGCRLRNDTVEYLPSANLRVPARLMVST